MGGVFGQCPALRYHRGDCYAYFMNNTACQYGMRRYLLTRDHRCHRDAQLFDILAGHDRHDPCHRLSRVGLHRENFSVRVCCTKEGQVQHSWKPQIIDVASFAGHQYRIFNPANRCADESAWSMFTRHGITSCIKG